MTRSHREIPQFHLLTTIDMSRALAWLSAENAKRSVADRLLYATLLIKAVAASINQTHRLNSAGALFAYPIVNLCRIRRAHAPARAAMSLQGL